MLNCRMITVIIFICIILVNHLIIVDNIIYKIEIYLCVLLKTVNKNILFYNVK